MSEIVLGVSRELMIRIDSLLSCLNHRHGNKMREIGELEEVRELATRVRKITEPKKPESSYEKTWTFPITPENECNCFHMSELKESVWICPMHGYKRL